MTANHNDSVTADDNDSSLVPTMNREALLDSVEPETVKTVVKLLLGMGGLVFLLVVVSVLPGLDRLVPATPITFAALVGAIVTLGLVAVLVYVAPHLETLVWQEFAGPDALAANVAAIVKQLVILVAVLVAYRGLAGAVVPFLADTDTVWAYDLAFLALALIPTALIARHLYQGLDPAADLLTKKVTTTAGTAGSAEADPDAESTGQNVSPEHPDAPESDPLNSDDEDGELSTDTDETSDEHTEVAAGTDAKTDKSTE